MSNNGEYPDTSIVLRTRPESPKLIDKLKCVRAPGTRLIFDSALVTKVRGKVLGTFESHTSVVLSARTLAALRLRGFVALN